jgi:hypothetical protein
MFKKKDISYYKDLTSGGDFKIHLTQDEACAALKAYDYGVEELDDVGLQLLNSVIGKLKEEIWP